MLTLMPILLIWELVDAAKALIVFLTSPASKP
jgi:hypothetical protein